MNGLSYDVVRTLDFSYGVGLELWVYVVRYGHYESWPAGAAYILLRTSDIYDMPIGNLWPRYWAELYVGPSTAIYHIRNSRFTASGSRTRTPPLEKGEVEFTLQPVNRHGYMQT